LLFYDQISPLTPCDPPFRDFLLTLLMDLGKYSRSLFRLCSSVFPKGGSSLRYIKTSPTLFAVRNFLPLAVARYPLRHNPPPYHPGFSPRVVFPTSSDAFPVHYAAIFLGVLRSAGNSILVFTRRGGSPRFDFDLSPPFPLLTFPANPKL